MCRPVYSGDHQGRPYESLTVGAPFQVKPETRNWKDGRGPSHQATPWFLDAWYITASAEGIDKVDAAFDKHFGGMSAEERRGVFADVGDLVDEDARRGYLSKVIHYSAR